MKASFLLPVFFHAVKDNGTIKAGWHSSTHFTNIYPVPGNGPRTAHAVLCKHIGGVSPQGAYDLF